MIKRKKSINLYNFYYSVNFSFEKKQKTRKFYGRKVREKLLFEAMKEKFQ